MIEDINLAIIGITIFLLVLASFEIINFLGGKKQPKQKIKEEKENNAGSWKIKVIGDNNDELKKLHVTIVKSEEEKKVGYDKNTRIVCNGDLKEAEQKRTKQICNNLLKIALKDKREREEKYKKSQSKLKKVLESESLLSMYIKTFWKHKKFLGRLRSYLDSEKMYFGVHGLEFRKGEKNVVLSINSCSGDYSRIERVIISVFISETKSFSNKYIEELTKEEFEETEKLLKEIGAIYH